MNPSSDRHMQSLEFLEVDTVLPFKQCLKYIVATMEEKKLCNIDCMSIMYTISYLCQPKETVVESQVQCLFY